MTKKIRKIAAGAMALAFACTQISSAYAEEETQDFSNTSYWNNLCANSSSLTAEERNSCSAYISYMQQQNTALSQKISDINSQKSEISANIKTYAQNVGAYDAQIDDINNMLTDLNEQLSGFDEQISAKQAEIDAAQASIDEKNAKIDELKERVKARMSEQQGTMRFGAYLDVLMGAATFSDFIRIANGLADISEKDKQTSEDLQQQVQELNDLQSQLESDKTELEASRQDQESTKNAMEERQADLLAAQYQAQVIRDTAAEQMVEINESASSAQSLLSSNQSLISSVTDSISDSEAAEKAAGQSAAAADQGSTNTSGGSTMNISAGDASGNPYSGGWGNCTWAAWQLAHDQAGVSLPWFQGALGMAGSWLEGAQAAGLSTGSTPAARSIAVFYTNHVGYVDQVNGTQVHIIEGNYAGLAQAHERWVDASTLRGYIYL